jgi:hypothetical protein
LGSVLHACSDSSMAISGVSDRIRNGYFSEYLQRKTHGVRAAHGQAVQVVCRSNVRPELLHVAPCLPHEPHRWALHVYPRGTHGHRGVTRACGSEGHTARKRHVESIPSPRAVRSSSGSALAPHAHDARCRLRRRGSAAPERRVSVEPRTCIAKVTILHRRGVLNFAVAVTATR